MNARRRNRSVLAIVAIAVASLTACGVPAEDQPKVIPDTALPPVLRIEGTTTSSSTSTTVGSQG